MAVGAAAHGGASRAAESRDAQPGYFTRALLTLVIYPDNIASELRSLR
jgi:hypothetical protein